LKVVDGGVAVFFRDGGNDGGEILLFVLLGFLPPSASIAFLVDLLILVVGSVPLVVLFVLPSDVVDVPLIVVPVESLPRVSPLVPSSLLFCVNVLLNPLPDPPLFGYFPQWPH
jgi:hypothetical protein